MIVIKIIKKSYINIWMLQWYWKYQLPSEKFPVLKSEKNYYINAEGIM